MSMNQNGKGGAVDLVSRYRPIGIRAVSAAAAMRAPAGGTAAPSMATEPREWSPSALPEGFHMPPSVLDD
ncbi:hypothetical protein [Gellertiella hungarica]|uniref:Uncharacterized protein n=1 Tax=Gellertiella hungarica TaxID=1572859 RepID=A0A7W6NM73_9HYPH|nr:hypothetical protein [Gellertiella hungarica]MBB4066653.1 hypothetical protein [Gellertiella hungarica]